MATRARKIPELPAANTIANADLLVVEKVSGNTSTTSKLSGSSFVSQVKTIMAVRGPFASDLAANNGGVAVGELYYTVAGDVKVRLT